MVGGGEGVEAGVFRDLGYERRASLEEEPVNNAAVAVAVAAVGEVVAAAPE